MLCRSTRPIVLVFAALLASACVLGEEGLDERDDRVVFTDAPGDPATFDVATWNIEWFGHASLGPADPELQRDNVRDIIAASGVEVWGLEEIVDADAFRSLIADLPGYEGILANDPDVQGGSSYYSRGEQKVAVLYRSDSVTVKGARIILTEHDHTFAGRPPLEVVLEAEQGGSVETLVVIVLHAKALTTMDSWQRRRAGSLALEAYLDQSYPDQRVMVIGDFNDDIDTSIKKGQESPYENFVDVASYGFVTAALTEARIPTTIRYPDAIDHHLVTDDLMASYLADSVTVWRVDDSVIDYEDTTSDHLPVIARYRWSGGGDGQSQLVINEILANEPGGSTAAEFVEIVNVGATAADLSGFGLSDANSVRHTFADGSVLEPGGAIVVFGGASAVPAELDNATAASSGSLGFNNSGDRVSLVDRAGATLDVVEYSSALSGRDGVSMNREIDGAGDSAFALHDSLAQTPSSPGLRLDGRRW